MFHRLKSLQKKLNFCKPIQTMKSIVQLQSMSSLHEKNIGNQFRLCSKLKNRKKIFTAETAGLKASTFSQTDPVERNWLTSKLQSSNSLLEVSKILQTDPVYELNWNSSKFQISKSLLKKIRLFQIWFSLNNFEIFQNFWMSHSMFKKLKIFGNWFCLWNHLQCFIV